MHYFEYKNGELYCEEVPLKEIERAFGTPVYIYSAKTLKRHFHVFDSAFLGIPHIVCYSLKANSNLAILTLLGKLGSGADVVSGGELAKALKAGIPPKKIVFSGVGKTKEELEQAVKKRILLINVESESELERLIEISERLKTEVNVALRVNPDIDPKTHPYITTGLKKNKFGISLSQARRLYLATKKSRYLVPCGISSHIGSQILELGPFLEALRSLLGLAEDLKMDGIDIKFLDIGGGLGITYKDELPPHPTEYGEKIKELLSGKDYTLILEPGRVIVGNSGILLTRIIYIKRTEEKVFYIVDAAMNDLIRPTLYNAYHEILPVTGAERDKVKVDIVGPVCESGDFFAQERLISEQFEGSLLAIMSAGAYGFSMSSNYNLRKRPAEVMVSGSEFYLIRKRETIKDLMRNEIVPEPLKEGRI
ncbi:MAG: diaminopimelate decarboxylase [Desulfobacterota bacterium]|nr:diaminopimelate decarboxylase [Thermodesulfobacteriota bacterium]MDW8001241.1 diaminopimelate decarboxylase [Deltaproteobacteria bacterium]